jgi:hypothetical protein
MDREVLAYAAPILIAISAHPRDFTRDVRVAIAEVMSASVFGLAGATMTLPDLRLLVLKRELCLGLP